MPGHNSSVFRFSNIAVHERELHIRRNGDVLPVEPKAFRVLVHLLRNPGRLVPKEELIKAGWGDTAVTDNSLTRNIALLRRLLGDDPREPRFIETVSTVGYRFVCPIELADDSPVVAVAANRAVNGNRNQTSSGPDVSPVSTRHSQWLWAVPAAALAAVAALMIARWRMPPLGPNVDSVTQLTDDGQIKDGKLASDGSRIYFDEGPPLSGKVGLVSITGGPTVQVQVKLVNPTIAGVMQDGAELIVLAGEGANVAYPLWAIPLPAGEPRRLGSSRVDSAAILSDGRVLFAIDRGVFLAEKDGSNPRKLVSLSGRVGAVNPSPDGKRILVQLDTRGDGTFDVLEIAVDGTGVREIRKASLNECCFDWSWDGNYLLYSVRAGNRWDIWALPVHTGVFRRSTNPIRLTTGPLSFSTGAIPSRDGRDIFAVASKQHGELVRYDMKSQQFVPFLSGISATDATFSADGKWLAYLSYADHSVWRCRSDETECIQLTFPPVEAQTPFISPDGARIAYTTDSGTFLVDPNGRVPEKVYGRSLNPMWSPDGNFIVTTNILSSGGSSFSLQLIDLRTGRASLVPGSEGKGGALWLDQKTLLASNATQTKLLTMDVDSGKWTDFFAGNFVNWINSHDRKYVYIATGGAEPSVQRIRVSDRQVETLTSLTGFARVINSGWTQLRVAPDGSPTLTRALDTQEIYALQIRWP